MENKSLVKKKTTVILCGGKGTRLGTLGKKVPKTLVKVQNKEIAVRAKEVISVQIYEKSSVAGGSKRPGFSLDID